MKKILSLAFSKMPLAVGSTPVESMHHDEAVGGWVEAYMTASSDADAIWYYERRRWRA